ncbi:hypothetical protein JI664_03655 [Rhodobacter sp. NTK016B]|uniref:hypothetical protein n=1 Tax=Rhodobacter sp. NTK016B TaxID=2759676 RepID=UPI001A8EA59C|nr:hypothetical protein [Rhodobacter sp. NTK016B]MBN8291053.1 hypothetical protein [Rhodobacter sp. NTK016B]
MTARAMFHKRDLTRAWETAQACGLNIARTEIGTDGSIVIVHDSPAEKGTEPKSAYDEWRAKRG